MYVIKHMVPVYVYVKDHHVTKVVVDDDDDHLANPVGIVRGPDLERGWTNEDVRPLSDGDKAQYADDAERDPWPGWELGW